MLRGCCFNNVYDLKLVYATPNLGAWEGEKFMLKIYVIDYMSPKTFKTKIQTLKKNCEIINDLKSMVFYVSINIYCCCYIRKHDYE